MPDMVAIAAVLGSLKTATEIVKMLREADVSLEKAELKLKLADLIAALAEAKIQTTEVQQALQERDERITNLEEAFESRGKLQRQGDAYYALDGTGAPTGVPFCLRCWDNDHRKRQLVRDPANDDRRVCPTCGRPYDQRLTREIQPRGA